MSQQQTTEPVTTNNGTSEPANTVGTAPEQTSQAAATGTAPSPEAQGQQQADQQQASQPAAPEKYDLTAPEGVAIGEVVTGKFTELAKKHALSQDAAQELYAEVSPLIAQQQRDALETLNKQWVEQSTNDQEFGGTHAQENFAMAKSTFEKFGTPELTNLLNSTGLGNHPEMIRWAYRVAKATSEDRDVGRMDGSGNGRSPDARSIYSKSNMNP